MQSNYKTHLVYRLLAMVKECIWYKLTTIVDTHYKIGFVKNSVL